MLDSETALVSAALLGLGGQAVADIGNPTDEYEGTAAQLWAAALTKVNRYPWYFRRSVAEMTRLSSVDPLKKWRHAFRIPSEAAGRPEAVFGDAGPEGAPLFAFEVRGSEVWGDTDRMWSRHVINLPAAEWPEYYRAVAIAAMQAEAALWLTGSTTLAEAKQVMAFGTNLDNGLGGAMGAATAEDAMQSGGWSVSADDLVVSALGGF